LENQKTEHILSKSIGIVTFLTLAAYFSVVVLFGPREIASISLLIGTVVTVSLIALYIKRKYPIKKVVISIGLGIALSLLFMVALITVGNALIHDMPATYSYSISVEGLSNYEGGLVTGTITL